MQCVISFGAVYLDINATDFPIPGNANSLIGTETVGKDYEMVLGGSAVNFAKFCQKLGIQSYFIGKTGIDFPSEIIEKLFKREKLHSLLFKDPYILTNLNTNIVSSNGNSMMLSLGSANNSLSKEDILGQLKNHLYNVDYLYLGGCFKLKQLLPFLLEITTFVRKQKKKIIIDHGRIVNGTSSSEKEVVRNVIKQSDYYLPSREEFLNLWNVSTIEEGLTKLYSFNKNIVVVKDAENGAWIMENGKAINVPSFTVKPVNTIGAGDSFNAGFIAALSEGKSLQEAVRFANATAALKISTNFFPTQQTIKNFLQDKFSDKKQINQP